MPLEAQTIEVAKRREETPIDRIGGRDARVYVKAWGRRLAFGIDLADDVGPNLCATTRVPYASCRSSLSFRLSQSGITRPSRSKKAAPWCL
jgi:hypothetical protein